MKRVAITAALLASLVGMSACAEGGEASNPDNSGGSLDGGFTVGTVTIDGKEITCIVMDRSAGNSKWGGLSCDWVAYHGLTEKPVEKEGDFE